MRSLQAVREACISLGMVEPISIEPDGTVWLGSDDARTYPDMAPILAECERIVDAQAATKQALLDRFGLTADEARLLLS
jgi:hypothetical protein